MQKINNFVFDTITDSNKTGEPQLLHSFILCVANVHKFLTGKIDPVWLMGSSAFAFRIFFEKNMCPSAMCRFEFTSIVPEVIKQLGRRAIYVGRTDEEEELEKEKRKEAHAAIVKEIKREIPAIAWGLHKSDWGIIIGYDYQDQKYICLSNSGEEIIIPYKNLGMNGVNYLSVIIPGKRLEREKKLIISNSLNVAVRHADGKEWINGKPKYQNGLAAYKLWINVFEKWAWLIDSGKITKSEIDFVGRAKYYAEYYYYARTFAYKYLQMIAGNDAYLNKAYKSYIMVAQNIKQLWEYFNCVSSPKSGELLFLAGNIRSAMDCEKEGIECIRKYLIVSGVND